MQTETTSLKGYVSPENPDGEVFGKDATSLIGFYGATPVVQPSGSGQAAVTITATTALATAVISQVGTSGKWAFSTSTAALAYTVRMKQVQVDIEAVGVLLNKLRTDLVALGAIKGSA